MGVKPTVSLKCLYLVTRTHSFTALYVKFVLISAKHTECFRKSSPLYDFWKIFSLRLSLSA